MESRISREEFLQTPRPRLDRERYNSKIPAIPFEGSVINDLRPFSKLEVPNELTMEDIFSGRCVYDVLVFDDQSADGKVTRNSMDPYHAWDVGFQNDQEVIENASAYAAFIRTHSVRSGNFRLIRISEQAAQRLGLAAGFSIIRM